MIAEEVLSGRETAARMARRYKVSEATVSRAMAAYRAMADAPRVGPPRAEDVGESQTIAGVLPGVTHENFQLEQSFMRR